MRLESGMGMNRMSLFREPARSGTGHLFVVDLARGLAALAVLFWHYQQFYYLRPGVQPLSPAQAMTQPFYSWLWPLYEFGHISVQFFWLLSGFVFAAVYVPKRATTRSFVVNRFARLYPLHLLTLIVVAIIQAISLRVAGKFQIIEYNDVYHFILQLFFASFWGLQKGYSFNGPIWSVSIEVLVYVMFWVTLPYLFRRGILGPAILAAAAWIFAFLVGGHLHLMRECIFYFFAGTAIFLLFNHWRERPWPLLAIAAVLTVALICVVTVSPTAPTMVAYSMPLVTIAALFTVCGLEALSVGDHIHRLRWIGDATYGIYLWHVPLQMVVLIYFSQHPEARAAIHQPWFLGAFFLVVLILARLSFVTIERPAREWLRQFARPAVKAANEGGRPS